MSNQYVAFFCVFSNLIQGILSGVLRLGLCTFCAGGKGSIPGRGTKDPVANNKINLIQTGPYCTYYSVTCFTVHDQISEMHPQACMKFQVTHFHRCTPTYDERDSFILLFSTSDAFFPSTTAEKPAERCRRYLTGCLLLVGFLWVA